MPGLIHAQRLAWLWLLGAANGLVLAFLLVGLTGWSGFVPLAAGLGVGGAALGLYVAYRSRFACAHLLGAASIATVWLGALVVAVWSVAATAAVSPALLAWGAPASLVAMAVCLTWGSLRTITRMSTQPPPAVDQWVDLPTRTLHPSAYAATPPGGHWHAFGPMVVAVANLPLLWEAGGASRTELALPIAVLMSCAVGWLAMGQLGTLLGKALWLTLQQHRSGTIWACPWQPELQQARASLPLARWLARRPAQPPGGPLTRSSSPAGPLAGSSPRTDEPPRPRSRRKAHRREGRA